MIPWALLPWRSIAGAAAVLAVLAVVWTHGNRSGFTRGDAGRLKVQAVLDSERLDVARRTAAAEREARAEEERRATAQQEIAHELERTKAQAVADAASAADAAGRLRVRVAALLAARDRRPAEGSAPAASGATADDAGVLLADLLGRCSARARFLATVADDRGAAGQFCQRSYDALIAPEP